MKGNEDRDEKRGNTAVREKGGGGTKGSKREKKGGGSASLLP